jgi:branched-chain amino acid aminotransferase
VVSQSEIHTSGLTSGTTDTVYRKNLIALIEKEASYKIIEGPISPFSLQKASSLFILNVKDGIIPISKYRKKEYDASDLPLKLGLLLEAKTKEASV